jgi:hypothetical protein
VKFPYLQIEATEYKQREDLFKVKGDVDLTCSSWASFDLLIAHCFPEIHKIGTLFCIKCGSSTTTPVFGKLTSFGVKFDLCVTPPSGRGSS